MLCNPARCRFDLGATRSGVPVRIPSFLQLQHLTNISTTHVSSRSVPSLQYEVTHRTAEAFASQAHQNSSLSRPDDAQIFLR